MIYLKNTTEAQECYIPRQDEIYGQGGGSHCGSYSEGYSDGYSDGFDSGSTTEKNRLSAITITQNTSIVKNRGGYSAITVNVPQTGGTDNLEYKTVVINSDITTVTPSSGYDGMSEVIVDAREYGQTNYDNGFDDGFGDGYASGSTDEKSKLSAVTFTANTAVTISDGGYSAVTVNVDTGSTYQSGYTSGYTSGHTDGIEEQKSLLSSTAFTENGLYSREDGWNEVNVNLNTAATWQEGYDSGFTDGSQGVIPDCDEAFNSGYASGVTDGENNIISTFSSMTATTNGIYGSSSHPLSSITVNVDTATTYQSGYTSGHTDGVNEEKAKLSATTFTANTAVTVNQGGYSAVTVNVDTATTYNSGYTSGYTDGLNDYIVTGSTAITRNGIYSNEKGWSVVSVNVPKNISTGKGYLVLGKYKTIGFDASLIKPNRKIELDFKLMFGEQVDYNKTMLFSQYTSNRKQIDGGVFIERRPTSFGVGYYYGLGIVKPTASGSTVRYTRIGQYLYTENTWVTCSISYITGGQMTANIGSQTITATTPTPFSTNPGGSLFAINDASILGEGLLQFCDIAVKRLKVTDTRDNSNVLTIDFATQYSDYI